MEEEKTAIEYAKYRLEKAKETLNSARILYDNNDLSGANNRAYYSIFYAIRAVLAIERIEPSSEKTMQQIETASELIEMVEKFLQKQI